MTETNNQQNQSVDETKASAVSIDEFKKIEVRAGKIISASKVEGADKLLKLQVDFGNEERQVISGIAEYFEPETLINVMCAFVTNLEPRVIRGLESQGMIMAASNKESNKLSLLCIDSDILPGTKIS